jgi:hypothetical protein
MQYSEYCEKNQMLWEASWITMQGGQNLSKLMVQDTKQQLLVSSVKSLHRLPKRSDYPTPCAKELPRKQNQTPTMSQRFKSYLVDKERCMDFCAWFQQLLVQHTRTPELAWCHLSRYTHTHICRCQKIHMQSITNHCIL